MHDKSYRKRGAIMQKVKYFICFILFFAISGCTLNQNQESNYEAGTKNMEVNNNNKVNESRDKKNEVIGEEKHDNFIDLEYIGSIENAELNEYYMKWYLENIEGYHFDQNVEFTWWEYWKIKEDLTISIAFDYILPDYVDREKKDVIISYGRKLKYLYTTGEYQYEPEGYVAKPVFEREYKKYAVYVYLIDKINLANSEFSSSDIIIFNKNGKIPYNLPSEE